MKEALKTRPFGILLIISLLLTLVSCQPSAESPHKELRSFAAAFREANQARTIGPMLKLYHLEGVEKNTLLMLEKALEYEMGLPIQSITFEPLNGAPEERIDYVHNGTRYGPSLTPQKRMRIAYAVDDGFTSLFTLGQTTQGNWRIVCARPQTVPHLELSMPISPR